MHRTSPTPFGHFAFPQTNKRTGCRSIMAMAAAGKYQSYNVDYLETEDVDGGDYHLRKRCIRKGVAIGVEGRVGEPRMREGKGSSPFQMPKNKGNRCGSRNPPKEVTSVKTNPLYLRPEPGDHLTPPAAAVTENEKPIFFGQRTKIRRTKEQEMITAIMDLAHYGERTMGNKKEKKQSILEKAKSIGKRSRQLKSPTRKSGPFILLRPRTPLRSKNIAEDMKKL